MSFPKGESRNTTEEWACFSLEGREKGLGPVDPWIAESSILTQARKAVDRVGSSFVAEKPSSKKNSQFSHFSSFSLVIVHLGLTLRLRFRLALPHYALHCHIPTTSSFLIAVVATSLSPPRHCCRHVTVAAASVSHLGFFSCSSSV